MPYRRLGSLGRNFLYLRPNYSRIAEVPEIELLQLGSAVTYLNYGAILKYNRIGEAEMIFCRRHFGKQCWLQFYNLRLWATLANRPLYASNTLSGATRVKT
jgi:hypothetical protein